MYTIVFFKYCLVGLVLLISFACDNSKENRGQKVKPITDSGTRPMNDKSIDSIGYSLPSIRPESGELKF